MPRTRYRSPTEDSARWDGFDFRDDDIVISTYAKSGTTWTQQIVAQMLFGPVEPTGRTAGIRQLLEQCCALRRILAEPKRVPEKPDRPLGHVQPGGVVGGSAERRDRSPGKTDRVVMFRAEPMSLDQVAGQGLGHVVVIE